MIRSITPKFWAHSNVFAEEHKKNKPTPGEERNIVIWYVVFVVLFPIILIRLIPFNNLRFYLSIIDIIANIFANVGGGMLLGRLYSPLPNDIISYISTNFLSLLALMGAAWTSIYRAMQLKSLWAGVFLSGILFTFTYLLPVQAVAYFIRHYSELFSFIGEYHIRIIATGLILMFSLMSLEYLTVRGYMQALRKFAGFKITEI